MDNEFTFETNAEHKTINLIYDQEVLIAIPKFECPNSEFASEKVVIKGKLKGYKDNKYQVAISVENSVQTRTVIDCELAESSMNICECSMVYDATTDKTYKIKDIDINDLYILGLNDRQLPYSSEYGDLNLKIGMIIKIYPESENYKIMAFNADLSCVLVCNIDDEMDICKMRIVDLDKDTIVADILNANIPYTYLKV